MNSIRDRCGLGKEEDASTGRARCQEVKALGEVSVKKGSFREHSE
jgi:hypothetical protein